MTREQAENALGRFEQSLGALEAAFDRYRTGVDRAAPLQQREALEASLRRLLGETITQTDLKFRRSHLSARFRSDCGRWDRLLREREEGRGVASAGTRAVLLDTLAEPEPRRSAADYDGFLQAWKQSGAAGAPPDRSAFDRYLAGARSQVAERYGTAEVEMRFVARDGKVRLAVQRPER